MNNAITVVDMRKFVEARDGKAFTTTHQVATAFGKLHNHVLAKVRVMDCSDQFLTDNFSSVRFEHRGNTYEAFEMTKDGFMFLVMGFTGSKAAAIKEGYITAFNWMAEQLNLSSKTLVSATVEQVLGVEGARKLSNVMRCRVAKMDAAHQRSATAKLSSALHACFGVPRIELIPCSQFEAAANFIAGYSIEGEYLGLEQGKAQLDIHFPLDALTQRRPEMLEHRSMGQAWLDVSMSDICSRPQDLSLCEKILCELREAGYEIDGAWFEVRSLRNRLHQLNSFLTGLGNAMQQPTRYAVEVSEGRDAA